MLISFIILIAIVSVLLILVVLVQNTKGGGITAQAPAVQIMGVKRTTDILEKSTWTLISLLIVLSIGTSFVLSNKSNAEEDGINSVNIERAGSAPAALPMTEEGEVAPTEQNAIEVQPEPATQSDSGL